MSIPAVSINCNSQEHSFHSDSIDGGVLLHVGITAFPIIIMTKKGKEKKR